MVYIRTLNYEQSFTMENKYLTKVKSFYKKYRRLPTYSEMAHLLGFSSKNAAFKVAQKWIQDGIFQKINNRLSPTAQFFSIPLLGVIKAGYPILADENKSYLTIDEYLINDPNETFLLKVSGDSMVEAGIFEGDLVIVENNNRAQMGDIVLAEIDREWTIKYLKQDNKKLFLEPANKNYPPLYPKRELKIRGVVKGVVRKLYS